MAKTKKRFGRDKAHSQGFDVKRSFEAELENMFERYES